MPDSSIPKPVSREGTVPDSLSGEPLTNADLTEAFNQVFEADYSRIVHFLLLTGASLVEAEDAAQDAFTQLYLRMARGGSSEITHPKAWMRTTALNIARRAAMRNRRDVQVEELPEGEAQGHEESTTAYLDVGRALATLPPQQRAVVALMLDNFAMTEIAEILGVSPGSVRNQAHRARIKLREQLAQYRST